MLVLERKGCEVFYNNKQLKINTQSSKGPNKEVVWVGDLEEANGQQWVSLSKLKEGTNEIECKARVIKNGFKYYLTPEEKSRIEEIDKEKEAIIENAKQRCTTIKNIDKIDIKTLNKEQIDNLMMQLEEHKRAMEANEEC